VGGRVCELHNQGILLQMMAWIALSIIVVLRSTNLVSSATAHLKGPWEEEIGHFAEIIPGG
jgi:hypothetical protein